MYLTRKLTLISTINSFKCCKSPHKCPFSGPWSHITRVSISPYRSPVLEKLGLFVRHDFMTLTFKLYQWNYFTECSLIRVCDISSWLKSGCAFSRNTIEAVLSFSVHLIRRHMILLYFTGGNVSFDHWFKMCLPGLSTQNILFYTL